MFVLPVTSKIQTEQIATCLPYSIFEACEDKERKRGKGGKERWRARERVRGMTVDTTPLWLKKKKVHGRKSLTFTFPLIQTALSRRDPLSLTPKHKRGQVQMTHLWYLPVEDRSCPEHCFLSRQTRPDTDTCRQHLETESGRTATGSVRPPCSPCQGCRERRWRPRSS